MRCISVAALLASAHGRHLEHHGNTLPNPGPEAHTNYHDRAIMTIFRGYTVSKSQNGRGFSLTCQFGDDIDRGKRMEPPCWLVVFYKIRSATAREAPWTYWADSDLRPMPLELHWPSLNQAACCALPLIRSYNTPPIPNIHFAADCL